MQITVLISTYNRPDLLRYALVSLNAQSRPPDEVVVADDGSKTDIISIIQNLRPFLNYSVHYVTQADKGFRLAKCRNNGIRIATGDYIISTDQDMVFTNNYISNIEQYIKKNEFLVSCCVRLTEKQTMLINEEIIKECRYDGIVTENQRTRVKRQFFKDGFYRLLHKMRLRPIGPKLRGGLFGAWRDDLIAVNGFDEHYIGWGNEDDDLGHRLYSYGVKGRNVTRLDYPIHLYHANHMVGTVRPNKNYYERRVKEIKNGDYQAPNGIGNPLGDDIPVVKNFS